MAQSLADARFELYRVTSVSSNRAELEPVRGSGAFSVWLTGPFLRAGDFGLMRVLTFDNELFIGIRSGNRVLTRGAAAAYNA